MAVTDVTTKGDASTRIYMHVLAVEKSEFSERTPKPDVKNLIYNNVQQSPETLKVSFFSRSFGDYQHKHAKQSLLSGAEY